MKFFEMQLLATKIISFMFTAWFYYFLKDLFLGPAYQLRHCLLDCFVTKLRKQVQHFPPGTISARPRLDQCVCQKSNKRYRI
jgi:hypothetical protein